MPYRIRDDRPQAPRPAEAAPYQDYDYVLYSCPDCGRDHFVTVDDCPDPAVAAMEVEMVDGPSIVAA